MDSYKKFRNYLLIFAGGMFCNIIGSKIVKTLLDWADKEDVKKED